MQLKILQIFWGCLP